MPEPIGVIPARGGSKRIPRKNIKVFINKPLIAYSIETLLSSSIISKIYVSTDDQEIADVALRYGADEIIWRNAQLSDDYATTLDVMSDSVAQLELEDGVPVCCAYATAPLMQCEHVQQGYKRLIGETSFGYVFPACHYDFPVQRGFIASQEGIDMLFPEHQATRSQDLPEVLHDAGQFYWALSQTWRNQSPIFSKTSRIIPIPKKFVQDLDTPEDWECLEALYLANRIDTYNN